MQTEIEIHKTTLKIEYSAQVSGGEIYAEIDDIKIVGFRKKLPDSKFNFWKFLVQKNQEFMEGLHIRAREHYEGIQQEYDNCEKSYV